MSRIPPNCPACEMTPTDRTVFEFTRDVCTDTLRDPDFREVADVLTSNGQDARELPRIVAAVTEDPSSQSTLSALASAVVERPSADARVFERFVLLTTAIDALTRLPDVPVDSAVKALFCEEFRFFASLPGEYSPRYAIGSASFVGMCKTASLRRFPGGQFDWEVGGIRRSDLAAVSLRQLPATLTFATLRMRGIRPVFFSHLNWRRATRSLLEAEANRSYYRMAQALRLQPAVKGFAACSWFRSPATHRVSPHLAWVSRVFVENGGFVVEAGPDRADSGVLHRSQTRRRLYDAGEFHPTKGLVMWPRDAMIAWAESHPEFSI